MTKQDVHSLRHKNLIYFKNSEMDFSLMWALGYQAYSGASIGEVFYAASRINEKDINSWVNEWTALAERVETAAAAELARQHITTATEGYLRAFTYYRFAAVGVLCTKPRYEQLVRKFEACFAQAASLLKLERVNIPFEGKALPGYFWRSTPAKLREKRPTIIVIGGGESYNEDLYFFGGAEGIRRDYNVLMVDIPGQGATAFDGLHYRADVEVPVKTAVDWLIHQPEVSPERIAIYGVSTGGYISLRAAAFEKRIHACAVSTPILDFHRLMMSALPQVVRLNSSFLDAAALLSRFFDPSMVITIQRTAWQMGVEKVSEALERVKTWTVDARLINCPVFCILGEGEAAGFKMETEECYKLLSGPKRLRVYTVAEGADAHCQVNNLRLAHQELYDWLDEVLS